MSWLSKTISFIVGDQQKQTGGETGKERDSLAEQFCYQHQEEKISLVAIPKRMEEFSPPPPPATPPPQPGYLFLGRWLLYLIFLLQSKQH